MKLKEKIKRLYKKYKESQNTWIDVCGRKRTGDYTEIDPSDPAMYAMITPIVLLGLGLGIYALIDGCPCQKIKQDSKLEQKTKSVVIDSVRNDTIKYEDSINYFYNNR